MIRALYNVAIWLYHCAFRFAGLFHEKARKIEQGRRMSRADIAGSSISGPVLWFHCASLGEWEQTIPVVENIRKKSGMNILLSFYSSSGFVNARRKDLADLVFYLPADLPGSYDLIFDRFEIKGLVFIRYDLWSNLILRAKRSGAKLFLIGGEVGPGSRYLRKGGFFASLLVNFDFISCNDPRSAELFRGAGYKEVFADGSPKLERAASLAASTYDNTLLEQWSAGYFVVIGGSIWEKETEILLQSFRSPEFAGIRYILVPHEPVKAVVEHLAAQFGDEAVLFSQFTPSAMDRSVIIVDSVGYLSKMYKFADLALVGGGFGRGIHNITEPAAHGLAVITGPENKKFSEAQLLEEAGVYFTIRGYPDFKALLAKISHEPSYRALIAQKASLFFKKQHGASEMIGSRIIKYLNLAEK